MFGIDSGELLIIAVVALVIIGPKDLPRVMRAVGQWVGRARGMARHFRTGMDAMIREVELEDMEKKWKADNERIMREHPQPPPEPASKAGDSDWGKPAESPEGSTVEAPPVRPKPPPAPAAGAIAGRSAPPIPTAAAAPPPSPPTDELP